jgi:lysophospholipase L1-like esterase
MRLKPLGIIVVNTVLLAAVIEVGAYVCLRSKGENLPPFFAGGKSFEGRSASRFYALDPHLGYARADTEPEVVELKKRFLWRDGFVIYKQNEEQVKPPIILTLGGSTTDGVTYGHSWPEELAKILEENSIGATVINGGTGGYSTNQELLKLLRDGMGFRPDIVISYSGINDRGRYSALPYPMIHSYQRGTLAAMTGGPESPLLPNTIRLLRGFIKAPQSLSPTFGVPSRLSLAEQYRRNMEVMNAVSSLGGARFFGFIQPFGFWKTRHVAGLVAREEYDVEPTLALYSEIVKIPDELPYVHDATQILEGEDGVYREDAVHLTPRGDRVVALSIFHTIREELLVRVQGVGAQAD